MVIHRLKATGRVDGVGRPGFATAKMEKTKGSLNYHLVGLGGSGMSALAQVLSARGHKVSGSDRSLDRGLNHSFFQKLSRLGVKDLPQDGTGPGNGADIVVVSSAIEETNPDIKSARQHDIPIVNRATLLSVLFNDLQGIAIGGTNGKTTVTGMTGWILDRAGIDPTVIAGGVMKNYSNGSGPGNVRLGRSNVCVIEADESDGSLVYYRPKVGVITNVTKDHKPMSELKTLFSTFAESSQTLVVGADCPVAAGINPKAGEAVTFGLSEKALYRATDVNCKEWSSVFKVNDVVFELGIPGRHNVMTALAATAAAAAMSVTLQVSAEALRDFRGIDRRLNLMGEGRGVKVIDDFAHNPQKIKAAIEAVRRVARRILAIYQPHGYSPTRFLKDELIQTFSEELSGADVLYMPEIFYAGGTAKKDISSGDITEALETKGISARFIPERAKIIPAVCAEARDGDVILVMGARDDTLTDFASEILSLLTRGESSGAVGAARTEGQA